MTTGFGVPDGRVDKVPHAEVIGSEIIEGSRSRIVREEDSQIESFFSDRTHPKRIGWVWPSRHLHFTEELGKYLWEVIRDLAQKDDWWALVKWELPSMQEPVRSLLHDFLVNLWSYNFSVPSEYRAIPLCEIARRSLVEGPSFAKWMDGFKTFLISKIEGRENFSLELEEAYKEVNVSRWPRTIGHIWRANQCFNWLPPNPDIEEITSTPVDNHPALVDEFREAVKDYLDDPRLAFFKPINDEFVGNRDSSRMAKEGPQWTLPFSHMSRERGTTRVAYIPRELKEARAAIVQDQPSLVRIRMIEANVRKILSLDNRSKIDSQPDTIRSELNEKLNLVRSGWQGKAARCRRKKVPTASYCRDFRKEGLTKPRWILRVILEELHSKFPAASAFDSPTFFDEWKLQLEDGRIIEPPRGHGLGMANALTTLMQIILEHMICRRMKLADQPIWTGYVNDDACLLFNNKQAATTYSHVDRHICVAMGMDFKDKSTFISENSAVLCEVYVMKHDRLFCDQFRPEDWGRKDSFAFASFANLMKSVNASHAREQALCMNIRNLPEDFLKQVTHYWGPVLYTNEHQRPREVGGWYRQIVNGVDMSYCDVYPNVQLPQMEDAARWAYLTTKRLIRPWRRPLIKKSKAASLYPKNWLEQRGEDLNISQEDMFRPQSDPHEFVRSWMAYEGRLKKAFSQACRWWQKNPHRRLTYGDLYKEAADRRPQEDIFPPRGEYRQVSVSDRATTDDVVFENPYSRWPREIDLHLYKWGWAQSRNYARIMGNLDKLRIGGRDQESEISRCIRMRHIHGQRKVPLIMWNLYLVPSQEVVKYWHDPFGVSRNADELLRNYSTIVPNYVPEEKQELLRLRNSHYGRELTIEEWMLIGTVKRCDQVVIWLMREYWRDQPFLLSGEYCNPFLEKIVSVLRKYPGFGNFVDFETVYNFETTTGDALINWSEACLRTQHMRQVMGWEKWRAWQNSAEDTYIPHREFKITKLDVERPYPGVDPSEVEKGKAAREIEELLYDEPILPHMGGETTVGFETSLIQSRLAKLDRGQLPMKSIPWSSAYDSVGPVLPSEWRNKLVARTVPPETFLAWDVTRFLGFKSAPGLDGTPADYKYSADAMKAAREGILQDDPKLIQPLEEQRPEDVYQEETFYVDPDGCDSGLNLDASCYLDADPFLMDLRAEQYPEDIEHPPDHYYTDVNDIADASAMMSLDNVYDYLGVTAEDLAIPGPEDASDSNSKKEEESGDEEDGAECLSTQTGSEDQSSSSADSELLRNIIEIHQ